MIWKQEATLEGLNNLNQNTLLSHLGIEFTEIGPDHLSATMPVDVRTIQPMGLLHGGASVVLAESLGSIASMLCLESLETQRALGLEINANHLRPVPLGSKVSGRCTPIKIGRSVHVWQIEIRDEQNRLSCLSRLTMSIVPA